MSVKCVIDCNVKLLVCCHQGFITKA